MIEQTTKQKQTYTIYDVDSIKGLKKIYIEFFAKNKCQNLLNLLNRFSVADAIINSGGTSILIEYKKRTIAVYTYDDVILEKAKYDNLKKTSLLFNCPVFYIMDFLDAVLVYQLDFTSEAEPDLLECPASNGSNIRYKKAVYHLKLNDASIIIGKRTWTKATTEQLSKYITLKKNEEGNYTTTHYH